MTALPKHIVVIGGSAGSIHAARKLTESIRPGIDAAFFIVFHLSRTSQAENLVHLLQKNSSLRFMLVETPMQIEKGHVYLGPADHHLLVSGDQVLISRGPHENRWRPSIDVLFRSAAANFNVRTIGIVLSGLLDDGVSGMLAIKKSGGTCIIQEPEEAQFSDMPANVLKAVDVDYRVPVADIAYVLSDLNTKPLPAERDAPYEVKKENEITQKMTVNINDLPEFADQSLFVCPDCGGGLWKVRNENTPRYRCHTGHVYTENVLLKKQGEELEESLWVSIRMLEERRNLLLQMQSEGNDLPSLKERADNIQTHIDRLRQLVASVS
jgi:two-component system, chemotaxis family, protein-glutamate methylesterase/glutaminase